MNVEKINQVIAAIRPEELWMQGFGRETKCGTLACVAGHTLLMSGYRLSPTNPNVFTAWSGAKVGPFDVSLVAATLLGLEIVQAEKLFYMGNWPEKFQDAYIKADASDFGLRAAESKAEKLRILKERVAHFIATEGRE